MAALAYARAALRCACGKRLTHYILQAPPPFKWRLLQAPRLKYQLITLLSPVNNGAGRKFASENSLR